MYGMCFQDAELPETVTLDQLRCREGQRMRALYEILAQQHEIGRFRRNYHPRPVASPGLRQPRLVRRE